MKVTKLLSALLAMLMLVAVVPANAFAANDYVPSTTDDYYKVISKYDYELAPGVTESEIVLNNATLSHRQVAHVVEVDMSNPYTKVLPSYKGMIPEAGKYSTQIMSEQAKWAEANGYGNVVAAMNISLSWYEDDYYKEHPELVGEPLGYMILNGEFYKNSQLIKPDGKFSTDAGAETCVVINFDEKDGVARSADMPKVELRSVADEITGWEEQVIPANFGFLVKNGKNQYSKNHSSDAASRSFVGIKEDGTFVMVMNDGRQAPYSTGFSKYEMAEFMISLGCVAAINGDGGGSSAFLSQRPGEELKLNCSPSEGSERPTTHGILVISTAPATGEFVRATISAPADYYTPGSSVQFTAIGSDLVGTKAEIPDGVMWKLADESMGTITQNGVFTSNGTLGEVTVQMEYDDKVVGEASINVVVPTAIKFRQAVMTVPFDKEVEIGFSATINGGIHDVVYKASDFIFTTTNSALGTFNGLKFTSVSEAKAPADLTSTVTATFVHDTSLVVTAALNLGKGSEILYDFEDATQVDKWNVADVNGNDEGFIQELTHATKENGKVHNGNGSMKVFLNPVSAPGVPSGGYGQSDLYLDEGIVVKNAKSIGFWLYIPEDFVNMTIRVHYWYDSNGDGKYEKKNTVTVLSQPEVYNTVDESGWRYFSVDISAYSSILIPGLDNTTNFGYNANNNDANNFRFIEFMFPHTNTNDLWKEYGTINGNRTLYIDNISADFSDAIEDRDAPTFSKIELAEANDKTTALVKHNFVTTTENKINVNAVVAENTTKTNATGLDKSTAKAYVDGIEVPVTFANGRMSITNVAVADGFHRVKFEIADYAGNKAVIIRLIKVESSVDASTIKVVPKDPTLDSLYGGSIYWMNLNATKIETIQSVKAVIDLNPLNHWELDNMELADGFTAEYSIDEEDNTATITITKTGLNADAGEVTLASLPIRVVYYDTDIHVEGYTAEQYWNTYEFWPYDVKVNVDLGEITYVNGYKSDVLNAFSNEEFSVDTELQTAFSNPEFKADRGTAHVHTPVAADDLDPTCTKDGYTGRTYCCGEKELVCEKEVHAHNDDCYTLKCEKAEHTHIAENCYDMNTLVCTNEAEDHTHETTCYALICEQEEHAHETACYELTCGKTEHAHIGVCYRNYCNSIVDWGTVVPATGHRYEVKADGFYTCDTCKETSYYKDGKHLTGWNQIEGNFYYFDKDGSAVDDIFTIGGHTYKFVDYVLTTPSWEKDGEYTIAYWADKQINGGWYTFNGNKYHFTGIYLDTGVKKVALSTNLGWKYHVFDENGIWQSDKTGIVKANGEYYDKNIDKDYNGDLYYAENGVCVYKGIVRVENKEAKDGFDYYYFNSTFKAVKGRKYSISPSKTNGLLPSGMYNFNEDGTINFNEEDVKNGLCLDEEDGEIRYYVNGEPTYAGVVKDKNDNLYYINSTKKAVKAETGKTVKYGIPASKTNGLIDAGVYEIDENGFIIDPYKENIKNGLHPDENGAIRYYVNGVAVYAGVVEDPDNAGKYFYINSTKKAVKAEGDEPIKYGISASKTNGLIPAGVYYIDKYGYILVNGKPDAKKGLQFEDGEIRFYVNGEPTYAGVVKDEEDNFYYINSTKKAVKAEAGKTVKYGIPASKTNGLIDAGVYEIDENGYIVDPYKANVKNGLKFPDDDGEIRFYENGKPTYKGVVSKTIENDDGTKTTVYAYINSTQKAVKADKGKTIKYSIAASKTNGLIPAGVYWIDDQGYILIDGKPILNGLQFEGNEIRYYVNGEPTYAGVVKDEYGNLYYINSTKKAVKAEGDEPIKYGISASKTNGLIPADVYYINKDGHILIDFDTGMNGLIDGYWYVDGIKTYAGVVEDPNNAGKYFYINSSKQPVKADEGTIIKYSIPASKTNGILPAGVYHINDQGHILIDYKPFTGCRRDKDGEIRYYVNDEPTYKGVAILTEKGVSYYVYIQPSKKAIKAAEGETVKCGVSASTTNGLVASGVYQFNDLGYMLDDDGNPMIYVEE